jgi:1-aminocyclopropane-1-carboxylate synthase
VSASQEPLTSVSSPADIIWSSLLNDATALTGFITENRRRLGEAHAFTREWFESRGVPVAPSNAGHFIWANLGARLGFPRGDEGVKEEKRVFQQLLDGGVYIVSMPIRTRTCSELIDRLRAPLTTTISQDGTG